MTLPIDRDLLRQGGAANPRYEVIATAFEQAIAAGQLRVGDRLPPVRNIARELGVSPATIAAAYTLLNRRGWVSGEVGRGTFVADRQLRAASHRQGAHWNAPAEANRTQAARMETPWRRRALTMSASRLRSVYPDAYDCTTGRPDPALLPLAILQRGWRTAIDDTTHADLQYNGPDPIDAFAQVVIPRLAFDGITAQAADIVVGSSAQQFMVLSLQVVGTLARTSDIVVAVEEPGYPTIFDTFERSGYRLLGVEVDQQGAIPGSLDAALASGANAVLLTPRAQNPTGASWSTGRVAELAGVLAAHPHVIAIEDDQFAGLTVTRPGSLVDHPDVQDRVIHIRSFSKSIAPDLRIAVAVARPHLRALLAESKSFADGWSSTLAQRALAHALADAEMETTLVAARHAYAERRETVIRAVTSRLALSGGSAGATDGVNVWVHLPPHVDAAEVIERTAALGVLIAPGEPFFIRPGRNDVVRVNAGAISAEKAKVVGEALATAALGATKVVFTTMSV